MTKTPTYRNWERFWRMHLTPEFLEAQEKDQKKHDCGSLKVVKEIREFYAALAGDTGDAPMPETLNNAYTRVANHLAVSHDLPQLDENEVTEEEFADLSPVFDALYDAWPEAFIMVVASAINAEIAQN